MFFIVNCATWYMKPLQYRNRVLMNRTLIRSHYIEVTTSSKYIRFISFILLDILLAHTLLLITHFTEHVYCGLESLNY